MVGVMHGMAGSAALLLLTATSFTSAPLGLLYIALFGAGSVAGTGAALGSGTRALLLISWIAAESAKRSSGK